MLYPLLFLGAGCGTEGCSASPCPQLLRYNVLEPHLHLTTFCFHTHSSQGGRCFGVWAVLCSLPRTCHPSSCRGAENPSSVTWCFPYFLAQVYLCGLELAANSTGLAGAHAASSCAAAPAYAVCFWVLGVKSSAAAGITLAGWSRAGGVCLLAALTAPEPVLCPCCEGRWCNRGWL